MGAERGVIMSNKEKHICDDCIHDDVCEWAVSNENMFICDSFIDKKVLERPQGEWIDDDNYYANCSCCGYQMDTHEEHGYFKFCPNCGSEMTKEAENV